MIVEIEREGKRKKMTEMQATIVVFSSLTYSSVFRAGQDSHFILVIGIGRIPIGSSSSVTIHFDTRHTPTNTAHTF